MYILIKRIFDFSSSFLTIIILLPVFIPVSLILRFTGEKEIFYFQNRVGLNLTTIKIFKFATMIKNSPNIGSGIYTSTNDPRILPFGKFLRKSKINELPQIFNILFGDMSVVGPRPLIDKTFFLYSKSGQEKISKMIPGLTGIASVIFRDEEEILSKSDLPLEEFYIKYITPHKEELELWYFNNKNFLTDLKIIIITVFVVLFPKSNIVYKVFKDLPKRDFN